VDPHADIKECLIHYQGLKPGTLISQAMETLSPVRHAAIGGTLKGEETNPAVFFSLTLDVTAFSLVLQITEQTAKPGFGYIRAIIIVPNNWQQRTAVALIARRRRPVHRLIRAIRSTLSHLPASTEAQVNVHCTTAT